MDPMLFEVENAGYSDGLAPEIPVMDPTLTLPRYVNGLALEASSMDPKLFIAVTSGKADLLEPLNTDILQQVTPIKDTAIHIAAGFGHLETIKSIHSRCPILFSRANSVGDTTLHVAARAGHFAIVRYLIDCAKTFFSSQDVELGQAGATETNLIRNGNGKKDTVMHEAVRNCNLEMVKLLIKEDPELLRLNNDAGESPLHIAVEKGELDIITEMLKAKHISYEGPNGRTALHAAVIHKKPERVDTKFNFKTLRREGACFVGELHPVVQREFGVSFLEAF
ncbi:hypothetical protein IFM89_023360 [Coptis chinensis]|uniref:Uncharacterized protein n=1 Tax=Coptis chinensis TaxID=261450 RepID=A0A835GXQ9_9MAGN|nr:hypothetical protein IFM89_023360 [Coptis chinensis]